MLFVVVLGAFTVAQLDQAVVVGQSGVCFPETPRTETTDEKHYDDDEAMMRCVGHPGLTSLNSWAQMFVAHFTFTGDYFQPHITHLLPTSFPPGMLRPFRDRWRL